MGTLGSLPSRPCPCRQCQSRWLRGVSGSTATPGHCSATALDVASPPRAWVKVTGNPGSQKERQCLQVRRGKTWFSLAALGGKDVSVRGSFVRGDFCKGELCVTTNAPTRAPGLPWCKELFLEGKQQHKATSDRSQPCPEGPARPGCGASSPGENIRGWALVFALKDTSVSNLCSSAGGV